VAATSTNPVAPYASWATAANVIQDAVDVANPGDTVLVTNGVYATGGNRLFSTSGTNRVTITKAITLLSVNGPESTIIVGHQATGPGIGPGAVRCVYLGSGAVLSGFTLTGGATLLDGSARSDIAGGGLFCASVNARATNCVITGNVAGYGGGGVSGGTLDACLISSNMAVGGRYYGGGAFESVLNRCVVEGNVALYGGGVFDVLANNSLLVGNYATYDGGGAGGRSTLRNCTVVGNKASRNGGGIGGGSGSSGGVCLNTVLYFNTAAAGPNYSADTSFFSFSNCCTTPLPSNGTGNISANPLLVSASRLSADSPCIGAGGLAFATGLDLDGEPWAAPPSIGCDEYYPAGLSGPLTVVIQPATTNVAAGFSVDFFADTVGRAMASMWDFGDGTVVTNQPFARHSWAAGGEYPVSLSAFNPSWPLGVSATVTVHVAAHPVAYVDWSSADPVPPYTHWANAARVIQDAVDVVAWGGTVCVTNGVYVTGGKVLQGQLTNRVAVDKPIRLRSVNGPEFTFIHGYQVPGSTNGDHAVRCVFLTDGAKLEGFTLTNGATRKVGELYRETRGGGVASDSTNAWVVDCVLVGNGAFYGGGASYGTFRRCSFRSNMAFSGGGSHASVLEYSRLDRNAADYGGGGSTGGTLDSCILTDNSAPYGGGADSSALDNCTVAGNRATKSGGGIYRCVTRNSTVYFNSAPEYANYENYVTAYGRHGSQDYTCTTPMPTNGIGNITNAPLFVDTNSWADLRLQSNSPCINAGNNAFVTSTNDLDNTPRIVGGTVDMGAYEFQSPQSVISYAWLQRYGLATDGSADYAHSDADPHNNWQEWKAWTDPTNELSVLRMLNPQPGTNGTLVTWKSVAGHSYQLERATNASASFSVVHNDIVGEAGTTSFMDTTATNGVSFLYRISVK
jgi:hypothetical protein